jgi:hypothetical protein
MSKLVKVLRDFITNDAKLLYLNANKVGEIIPEILKVIKTHGRKMRVCWDKYAFDEFENVWNEDHQEEEDGDSQDDETFPDLKALEELPRWNSKKEYDLLIGYGEEITGTKVAYIKKQIVFTHEYSAWFDENGEVMKFDLEPY